MLFHAFHSFRCIWICCSMSSLPRRSHRLHHHSLSPDTWHIAHYIGSVVRYGGRHYACGGVFVIRSVVDDDEADTIQSLLRLWRRLCCYLRRQWQRRYEFIHVAPAAAPLLFALSSMTKTIRIHSCYACGGIFVVCFVVDDEDNMNSILLATNMVFLS